jgi:hypothetical protein
MKNLSIYNKLFLLFFALLILIIIMKVPREKSETGKNHAAVTLDR